MPQSSSPPRFFATPADFRAWLKQHHRTAPELSVGFYKRGSGRPSITWPEAVDEALCFGWIDGVRHRIDEDRYRIRFTPRLPKSTWSAVNLRRVAELTKAGRMRAAGLRAFANRIEAKTGIYAYEQRRGAALDAADEAQFRADPAAWKFFAAQPAWYRHRAIWRVVSGKRDETRRQRLAQLIETSAAGRRL